MARMAWGVAPEKDYGQVLIEVKEDVNSKTASNNPAGVFLER